MPTKTKIFSTKEILYLWLVPVAAMLLLAPLTPTLDLAISSHFYRNGSFSDAWFYQMMFTYGPVPGWMLFAGSVALLATAYRSPAWRSYRRTALVLVLTLGIGGGLITQGLKDHWGRPRPRQVVEFGGQEPFRPFYSPNLSLHTTPYKSFPSGHASIGFYFLALMRTGQRSHHRRLAVAGALLASVLGGLLSLTRVAQGGHFFSDALASALVMWLSTLAVEWLVYRFVKE